MVKNKLLKTILLILIIPLIAEVFFFNFRFWESLFFKKQIPCVFVQMGNNITIADINEPVKNIHLDLSNRGMDNKPVHMQIHLYDEANSDLVLPVTEVVPQIEESNYIRIYPDGNVREITIEFDKNEVPDAAGIGVTLNETRPFYFEALRFIVMVVIISLFMIFRPGSAIYKMPLCGADKKITDRNKIFALLMMSSLAFLWILIIYAFNIDTTPYYKAGHVEAIYTYQAESLLKGHTWLDYEPPKYLSEMENPYDFNERVKISRQTGESFKLDFAFFEGKYYSYYGIVPTLLFYLPFVALTGLHLSNSVPILIMGILYIIFSFLLVYKLIRRHYSDVSLGVYFLLTAVFVFGTGAFYCAGSPHIYAVAFISALMFTVIALYNWISASDKHFADISKPLSKARLILGAVFMGLAVGSRPVFGLYALLALPLFYSEIKERLFFSKKGIANTLCVIAPLLVIGSALLYFNKLRFGSFFDFGNTYNLSEMDLQNRHFAMRRLWLGFFEYLFQPLKITGTFPYVESVYDYQKTSTDYMGYMFFDPVFGGYFALCPVCLVVFLIRKFRKSLNEMKAFWLCAVSLAFAAFLIVLDIEMTGITLRYQMDFGMLLVIPAVFILIALIKKAENSTYKNAFRIVLLALIVLAGITVFNNLFIMLADEKARPLLFTSQRLYYSLKYLVFSLR